MLPALISSLILHYVLKAAILSTNNDCLFGKNEEVTTLQNESFTDICIKSGEKVLISNSSHPYTFESLIIETHGRIIIDQEYSAHISVNHLEIGTLQIGSKNNCEIVKDFKISKTNTNQHVKPITIDTNTIWIPYQLNDTNYKSQLIHLSYDIYGIDMEQQEIIVNDMDHMDLFRIIAAKSPNTYTIEYLHDISGEILSHVNHIGLFINSSKLEPTRRRLPGGKSKEKSKVKPKVKSRRKSAPHKTLVKKIPVLKRAKSDTDLLRTAWAKKVSIYQPVKKHETFKKDNEVEKIKFVKKLSEKQAEELHSFEELMVTISLPPYFKKSAKMIKKHKSAGDKPTDTSPFEVDLPLLVMRPGGVAVGDSADNIYVPDSSTQNSQNTLSQNLYPIIKPMHRKVSLEEQMTKIRNEWDRISECIWEEEKEFKNDHVVNGVLQYTYGDYEYFFAAGREKDIFKSYSAWKDTDLKSTKSREHLSRAGMLAYNAGGMGIAVATLNVGGMTLRGGKIINDVATYALIYTGTIEKGNEKDTALTVFAKWIGKKLSKKKEFRKWRKERWWTRWLQKISKPKGGDIKIKKAIWQGVKTVSIETLKKAVIPAGALAVTLSIFPPVGGVFVAVSACALLTWVVAGGIVKGIYLTSQNSKEAKEIHGITGNKVALLSTEFDMDDLPLEYRKRIAYMMQFPNSFRSVPDQAIIPKAIASVLNTGPLKPPLARVEMNDYLNDYYISKDDLYDYQDFSDGYYDINEREFDSNEHYYEDHRYYYDQTHINYNEMKMYSNMLLVVFLAISVVMVMCIIFTCICSLVISRYVSKYFEKKRKQDTVQNADRV
eukprot:63970_1